MTGPPLPPDDDARVESLRSLRVLDTPPEERFDRLTRLARRLFEVPIALVSFVDRDRQWVKSCQGVEMLETPRELSFCAHAILQSALFVVPDTTQDDRFRGNPAVKGDPNIRFYAGRPVKAPDGALVGTLCILDYRPRTLTAEDERLLNDLGTLVEEEFRTLQLVTTDDLTGLTNRRGFRAIAFHTLALCRRLQKPATLMILDLDQFKEVNDTLGHAAGDRILKEFSRQLLDVFRDSDVVARLGGDEFAVLLSGTDEAHASRPLGVLEARLEAAHAAAPEVSRIRFSAGAAHFDEERHPTVDELLHEADLLMYQRKRARR